MSVAVGGDPVSGIYSAEHLCVFPLIAQSFDKETYSLAQAHVQPGESDGAVSQRSEAVATVGRLAETIGRLAALEILTDLGWRVLADLVPALSTDVD